MKKAGTLVLIAVLVLALAVSAAASSNTVSKDLTYRGIRITLNGEELSPKDANGSATEPFLMDDSTYLPVRAVADALGMDVAWDDGASTVMLTSAAPAQGSLKAAAQPEQPSPDWVTALPSAQDPAVSQLFVVAGMGMDKTTATVSMHRRDADGQWKQILSTPGFVGRNGLCPDEAHKEGCGQTPIGVYTFNKALGIAPDPGCALPYTQVTDDAYWSGDMRDGMHYNELVSLSDCPGLDTDNSEHIVDYEYEYQYVLNISFNADGTPGRGSAIFLHCFGVKKPQTGGCVAIPEYCMAQVMRTVRPDCVVVIDTLEHLGGSL